MVSHGFNLVQDFVHPQYVQGLVQLVHFQIRFPRLVGGFSSNIFGSGLEWGSYQNISNSRDLFKKLCLLASLWVRPKSFPSRSRDEKGIWTSSKIVQGDLDEICTRRETLNCPLDPRKVKLVEEGSTATRTQGKLIHFPVSSSGNTLFFSARGSSKAVPKRLPRSWHKPNRDPPVEWCLALAVSDFQGTFVAMS